MDELTQGLTVILVLLFMFIIALAFIYWYISFKSKQKKEEEEVKQSGITQQSKVATTYIKKSIFKFMQFDKIEDNMIVQDNGTRYLMVIGCEGVNYDLMSQVEKNSVEAGFVQFLNTLRFPVQLYTQTRTINISESISNYKTKLEGIKKELDDKEKEFKILMQKNGDEKKLEESKREVVRLRNLYEYGADIIDNIQKTSQNKNVLRKHYYIVVPYYASEIGVDVDENEKRNMIFAELYTRAQSLIRVLFACDMKCRILDSNELVELLYEAYNRDDAEIFGVDRALQAGYTELYATAPDVLDKQMRAIDAQIDKKVLNLVKDTIDEVRAEKEKKIKEKQNAMEDIVKAMAEDLLKKEKKYIGEDVAEAAITKIAKNDSKEGGNKNGKKTVRRARKSE